MKLLMDFVLNHSSNKHPWFLKSEERIDPYTDYYVWKDPKGYDQSGEPIPPNNWRSIVGGAWQWNSKRKQFYYHYFNQNQVDFNLRNTNMLRESKNIIKFWFDKGVAGGRLDCAGAYMEDTLLRDEDYSVGAWPNPRFDLPDDYRKYQYNQWESYQFIHELREFIDSHYNSGRNDEKILIAETHTTWNHTIKYYGNDSYKIVHFPLNDILTYSTLIDSPKSLDNSIRNWLKKMPDHGVANWQLENHDKPRLSNRLQVNPEYSDILLILMMMLPGVACVYYGQEIGMENTFTRLDQVKDFMGRDAARSPMQWDDSTNAGFSSNGRTWLPVHPKYWQVNVKTQKKQPNSRYNLYKTLSKLRKTATLKYGAFTSYLVTPWVYAFMRSTKATKEQSFVVVINMGSETEVINLHTSIPHLPPTLKVLAASMNAGYAPGRKIHSNAKFPDYLVMRPSSVVVVKT